jgi:hypothetical protein
MMRGRGSPAEQTLAVIPSSFFIPTISPVSALFATQMYPVYEEWTRRILSARSVCFEAFEAFEVLTERRAL